MSTTPLPHFFVDFNDGSDITQYRVNNPGPNAFGGMPAIFEQPEEREMQGVLHEHVGDGQSYSVVDVDPENDNLSHHHPLLCRATQPTLHVGR